MQVKNRAIEFLDSRKSLVMSTLDDKGQTETSVAACLFYEECFYIFISELSQHTQNLLKATAGDQKTHISGLLLADEVDTEQMFARERLSFQFLVEKFPVPTKQAASESNQANNEYQNVLQQFAIQFGEVVSVLQSLPDFHLFKLIPQKGNYVVGFGQAFAFDKLPHYGLKAIKK